MAQTLEQRVAARRSLQDRVAARVQPPPRTPDKGTESLYEKTGIGSLIGAAATVVDAVQAPVRKAVEKIESSPAFAPGTPGTPNYVADEFKKEAAKKSLQFVASMFLDPTNLPFILTGGVGPSTVRPAIRIGADALMVAVQQVGALKAAKEGNWEDAALQQAFAMVGLAGVSGARRQQLQAELQARAKAEKARTDAQIQSDLDTYKKWSETAKQDQQVAAKKPSEVEPVPVVKGAPKDPHQIRIEEVRNLLDREKKVAEEAAARAAESAVRVTDRRVGVQAMEEPLPTKPVETAPTRLALPPGPTVELPGGGIMRPPQGEPGGIPPRNEQTVTPTLRPGVTKKLDFKKPVDAAAPVIPPSGSGGAAPPVAAPPAAPPVTPPTVPPVPAVPVAKAKPRPKSTVKSLYADLGRIREHAGKGNASPTPGVATEYIAQIRGAMETHYPEGLAHVERAEGAIQSGDMKLFASEAEKARGALRKVYGERLARSEAERQGLLPAETSKTPEPPAKTPREQLRDDIAGTMADDFLAAVDSGVTELTGKWVGPRSDANVNYGSEGGGYRAGGIKQHYPAIANFPENPGVIAKALRAGKGALYDRVMEAFRKQGDVEFDRWYSKASPDQRKSLLGDDALTFEQGESKPLLARNAEEAVTMTAAGRPIEQLKEGQVFDETRLVDSELFQGKGGKQRTLSEIADEPTDADISFSFGETAIKKLDDLEAKTKADIKKGFEDLAKGSTLGAGLPTKLTADLVKLGAIKIAKGSVQFAQWSAEMVEEFGERVKPYLRDAYTQSVQRAKIVRDAKGDTISPTRLEALLERGEDPVTKLTQAIKVAGSSRRELEAAYKAERAQRAATVRDIMGKGEGQKGFRESLGALKGEMAADLKNFESLKLDQTDVDALFNEIQLNPRMRTFDKVSTADGLQQMLNGRVPKQSQLALLEEVFGKDLVSTLNQKRPYLWKLRDFLTELANVPRSLITSFDMSAPLRQGVILTTTKPKAAGAAAHQMFRQVFSPKNFDEWLEKLPDHPNYTLMEDSGLYIADPRKVGKGLEAREEKFMSEMAEKIPVVGGMVRASQRAYIGYLNKLRVDVFDQLASKFIKEGLDPEKDAATFKSLASFVNNATGRGELPGRLNRIPQELNTIFFSPRLIASRFNMLNPAWYAKQDKLVRKEAIKSMAEFIGIGSTVLALAKANGAEVELDPRSTDFGKIKIGNTRWDIWGGFQQWVRVFSQMASGYRKTAKGDVMKLAADEFPYDTRLNVGARFIRGKLAPIPNLALELLEGQKLYGEKMTLESEAIENTVPLYLQDIHEAMQEMGPEALFTVGVPGFAGVGVQHYKERPPQGAIHSTMVDHLSDPVTDAVMGAKITVGPVTRKKEETAEEYRLRQELVGKLIDERVGLAIRQGSFADRAEERKTKDVEDAIGRAREIASNLTRRTFKSPEEAATYLQGQIDRVQGRLERAR